MKDHNQKPSPAAIACQQLHATAAEKLFKVISEAVPVAGEVFAQGLDRDIQPALPAAGKFPGARNVMISGPIVASSRSGDKSSQTSSKMHSFAPSSIQLSKSPEFVGSPREGH